jgi:hypothetical protein
MNKSLIAILFITTVVSTSWTGTKYDSYNYLAWNENRKLQWEDFKGVVNTSSHADAATAIHISARPYYKKKKLYYDVDAFFIKEQSWCRSRSNHLLNHEQLHFDIAELYARKVRKKISQYHELGIKDVNQYNNAIRKILDESNRLDASYDLRTIHGSMQSKQLQWEKNIRYELNALQDYSREKWLANLRH